MPSTMRQWFENLNLPQQHIPDWGRLPEPRRRELFFGIVIILVLTVTGPFGTGQDLIWPFRLIYWGFIVIAGGFSARIVWAGLHRWLESVQPLMVRLIVRAAIVALPVSAVVLIAESIFRLVPPLMHWPAIYLGVLVILASLLLLAKLRTADAGDGLTVPSEPDPSRPSAENPLSGRLPERLRSEPILALKAEDHYLRVITAAGDEQILMRLADAMAALGAETGVQAHRSWWVARDAIAEVIRREGKAQLRLVDGTEVPISRRRLAALQEEGIL